MPQSAPATLPMFEDRRQLDRRLDFSDRPLTESHCVTDHMRRRGVEAYETWFATSGDHFENCVSDIFLAMLKAAAE